MDKPGCSKTQRPTECSVCGKAAHGYHYDVPSCNGCKTFFRRMCISEKNFACKADGDCFDLVKREDPSKCRACRYQKCLSVGMNPLAMKVDETEANAANFKKLVKRIKEEDVDDDDAETHPKTVVRALKSAENRLQKLVDNLIYLDSKVEAFRFSAYNPDWKTCKGLSDLLLSGSKIDMADKAGPMPGWPLKGPTSPAKVPSNMSSPPVWSPSSKSWLLFDLMTTIEYAKTFMFFHKLGFDDRFALLRYVSLAVMNLHISFFSVAKKFDSIVSPDGTLPPVKKGMVYAESVMSMSPLIRYDVHKTEYVLLKAICLCNPAVPNLSEHAQSVLAEERRLYARALFEQCLRDRHPSHFAHVIGILEVLERQQRMQKDLHLLHIAPFAARIPKHNRMALIEDIMDS